MTYVKPRQVEIAPEFPLITVLALLAVVFCFMQSSGVGLQWWLEHNCLSLVKLSQLINCKDYVPVLINIFYSSFICANILQLLVSLYYIWSVGHKLEQFLEAKGFLLLLFTTLLTTWLVMFFEKKWLEGSQYNVGPALLIFACLGGLLVLPTKKRHLGPVDRSKVVQHEETSLLDNIKSLDPKFLLLVYISYEAALEYYIRQHNTSIVTIQPLMGIFAFVWGMIFVGVNLSVSSEEAEHRPMRNMAKKLYKQMRNYDLSEKDAILAVSKELKVPYFQIKEWISK